MKTIRPVVSSALAVALVSGAAHAATIVVDGYADFTNRTNFLAGSYDASASDKLVVVVAGEHNFGGNTGGQVSALTYDGVALTQAVDRNPFDGTNITAADIWYLDNPGDAYTLGKFAVTVGGNGNNYVFTVIGLSNTLDGVGGTAISDPNSKSVNLTAVGSDSLVIASHAMGGNGNTADTQNVNADLPAIELTAVKAGSSWAGHVVSTTNGVGAGTATYTFTGGNAGGNVTIAAEFLAVPEPGTIALLGLGGLMIARRRRA